MSPATRVRAALVTRALLGASAAAALAACGHAAPAPAGARGATAAPGDAGPAAEIPRAPRTVVALVVDQLAAWTIDERLAALPEAGGFRRLAREGTWATLLYDHALTDTAPGHAALFTGEPPARSGIFGNAEPVDVAGATKLQSLLVDPTTTLLAPPGGVVVPPGTRGVSARRLRAPTVARALADAVPGARVASLSLKDRGSVIPAGSAPADVVFFEGRIGAGGFVTSSAYGAAFPPALAEVAAKPGRWPATWTPLDAAWLAAHADGPDDDPTEGDFDGLGRTFPHPVRGPGAFRASPFGNAALVELARAWLRATPDAPVRLLMVSFSSYDIVAHVFGPDSHEAWDVLLRLDADLAALFAELDATSGGPAGWAATLAADHGSARNPGAALRTVYARCRAEDHPDRWGRACGGGERLDPGALREAMRKELARRKLAPALVREVADSWVWLAPEAKALSDAQRHELDHVVREVVARAGKGAFETVDARSLADACGAGAAGGGGDEVTELLCNTMADGAGDYYLVPQAGSYVDPGIVPGFGSSHGSPWRYDRAVPLFVRGPGAVPGARPADDHHARAHAAVLRALLGLGGTVPEALAEARVTR